MTTVVNINKEKFDVYIAEGPSKWEIIHTYKGKITKLEFVSKTRKKSR